MRHRKKFNHLTRKSAHRKAMFRNMSSSLIKLKRITTTLAKAKALRKYVEPVITKAKRDTTHARRTVMKYLNDKEAVKELFGPVAEKIGDRPGGYLRVIRIGHRKSDGAEMAMVEFVDYNEVYKNINPTSGGGRRRRRRTRRGGSGGGSHQKSRPQSSSEEE